MYLNNELFSNSNSIKEMYYRMHLDFKYCMTLGYDQCINLYIYYVCMNNRKQAKVEIFDTSSLRNNLFNGHAFSFLNYRRYRKAEFRHKLSSIKLINN